MRKFNRRTKVVILSVILATLFAGVYAAGLLLPDSLADPSFLNTKLPPSWQHPFGTDALGRDLFFRTLKGLSISMTIGLLASVISAVIAVLVGIAAAMGGKAVVRITESYPGIVNDDKSAGYIENLAADCFDRENVSVLTDPFMTTEDFGYYLAEAPGCFYHIGCDSEYPLHSDRFCPDEKAILTAMIMHVASIFM